MTKKANLTPVEDTTVNTNLNRLNTKFDNTLSLDGSTPNAMNADLDMNDNDILNAKSISTDELYVAGEDVSSLSQYAEEAAQSAQEAEESAQEAALYDGPKYDTIDELEASNSTFTDDEFVRVIEGGAVLKAVSSGATVTNAGGQGFVVVKGPEFNTRSATTLGEIAKYPDGTIGYAAGLAYEADSSKTGTASAGNDVSVDGVKTHGVIDFRHFGLKMDGTTDDKAAWDTACSYASTLGVVPIRLVANGSFVKLNSSVTLREGNQIYGAGMPEVRMTVSGQDLLSSDNVGNISVQGIHFRGEGSGYDGSSNPAGRFWYALASTTACSKLRLRNCRVENFVSNGFRCEGAEKISDIEIAYNKFVGIGGSETATGAKASTIAIAFSGVCENVRALHNLIEDFGFGVITSDTSEQVTFESNIVTGVWEQHGGYFQSQKGGLRVINNFFKGNGVAGTAISGFKLQSSNSMPAQSDFFEFIGNTVQDFPGDGIKVYTAGTPASDERFLNGTVNDNKVYNVGNEAFEFRHVDGFTAVGNEVDGARVGLNFANLTDFLISNFNIRETSDQGVLITDEVQLKRGVVTNIKVYNPNNDGTTSPQGVEVQAATDVEEVTLDRFDITGTSTNMTYGVRWNSADQSEFRVTNWKVRGATATSDRHDGTTAFKEFRNNEFEDGYWAKPLYEVNSSTQTVTWKPTINGATYLHTVTFTSGRTFTMERAGAHEGMMMTYVRGSGAFDTTVVSNAVTLATVGENETADFIFNEGSWVHIRTVAKV